MRDYPVQTAETAAQPARPVLEQVEKAFGIVPNIAGAMANSPELLRGFWGLFSQVHAGSFSEAEIQTLLLTNAVTNASSWAVAFHSMLALKEGLDPQDVTSIRSGRLPADARLAALSAYARALIETRGQIGEDAIVPFLKAGFSRAQSLEVLAVTAASTITNYTGSITNPPLEDFLRQHAWPD
jgi:alkylhydroperoxidase family enzyme